MDPESFSLAGKVFLILNTVSSRARFVSKASGLELDFPGYLQFNLCGHCRRHNIVLSMCHIIIYQGLLSLGVEQELLRTLLGGTTPSFILPVAVECLLCARAGTGYRGG